MLLHLGGGGGGGGGGAVICVLSPDSLSGPMRFLIRAHRKQNVAQKDLFTDLHRLNGGNGEFEAGTRDWRPVNLCVGVTSLQDVIGCC